MVTEDCDMERVVGADALTVRVPAIETDASVDAVAVSVVTAVRVW